MGSKKTMNSNSTPNVSRSGSEGGRETVVLPDTAEPGLDIRGALFGEVSAAAWTAERLLIDSILGSILRGFGSRYSIY